MSDDRVEETNFERIDDWNNWKANIAQAQSSDAFGRMIADGTTNELDIASQYNYSPERLRIFNNGSRVFPEYGAVSVFTDEPDVWRLQPGDGDTVSIESAESVTYTVQYVVSLSCSFQLNQSLKDGDMLRVGPYNGVDGWFMEHRGSDHSDDEVDLFVSKAGAETLLEGGVTLARPLTEFNRYAWDYNWYNVGNQVWTQTFTSDGDQINNEFARTSRDGMRSTDSANMPVHLEIDQAAGNTGTELLVGSISAITLGQITNLTRSKQQNKVISVPTGNDNTWTPIYAIRINPEFTDVNAQMEALEILSYANNADIEMVVASVDPGKTDASGWTTPDWHHDYNSAIQETENVSQVPRASDGLQVDLDSTEKPGGFTIASAIRTSGGGQSATSAAPTSARQTKKNILDSDVIVFCVRTSSSGANVKFIWESEQNW